MAHREEKTARNGAARTSVLVRLTTYPPEPPAPPFPSFKKCTVCNVEKPLEDFRFFYKGKYHRYPRCKSCCAKHNREYSKTHKARASHIKREMLYRSDPKYRMAVNTHQKVHKAVKKGIIKKLPCAICEDPKSQAHHADYSKPLEVVWFCDLHHKEEHVRIKNERRSA